MPNLENASYFSPSANSIGVRCGNNKPKSGLNLLEGKFFAAIAIANKWMRKVLAALKIMPFTEGEEAYNEEIQPRIPLSYARNDLKTIVAARREKGVDIRSIVFGPEVRDALIGYMHDLEKGADIDNIDIPTFLVAFESQKLLGDASPEEAFDGICYQRFGIERAEIKKVVGGETVIERETIEERDKRYREDIIPKPQLDLIRGRVLVRALPHIRMCSDSDEERQEKLRRIYEILQELPVTPFPAYIHAIEHQALDLSKEARMRDVLQYYFAIEILKHKRVLTEIFSYPQLVAYLEEEILPELVQMAHKVASTNPLITDLIGAPSWGPGVFELRNILQQALQVYYSNGENRLRIRAAA